MEGFGVGVLEGFWRKETLHILSSTNKILSLSKYKTSTCLENVWAIFSPVNCWGRSCARNRETFHVCILSVCFLFFFFFFRLYMSDFYFLMDGFVLLLDWHAPQRNACSVTLYGVLFLTSLNKIMYVYHWNRVTGLYIYFSLLIFKTLNKMVTLASNWCNFLIFHELTAKPSRRIASFSVCAVTSQLSFVTIYRSYNGWWCDMIHIWFHKIVTLIFNPVLLTFFFFFSCYEM